MVGAVCALLYDLLLPGGGTLNGSAWPSPRELCHALSENTHTQQLRSCSLDVTTREASRDPQVRKHFKRNQNKHPTNANKATITTKQTKRKRTETRGKKKPNVPVSDSDEQTSELALLKRPGLSALGCTSYPSPSQAVASPISRATQFGGCHRMPSYLGTDVSESKKPSKNNHNGPFPHLGQTRKFPRGHGY